MTLKKPLSLHLFLVLYFIRSFHAGFAQIVKISNDVKERKIVFGNERMTITVDYNHKAAVSKVQLNSQEIINRRRNLLRHQNKRGSLFNLAAFISTGSKCCK